MAKNAELNKLLVSPKQSVMKLDDTISVSGPSIKCTVPEGKLKKA